MNVDNVLICLVGKSPQILTEALYFLEFKQRQEIQRIIIITTNDCRGSIEKTLSLKLKEFQGYYNLKKEWSVEYLSADDELYNKKSSSSLTKLIFDVVKSEKLRGNTLHCLISGGRKTMSVDLAIALSVFGGDADKMYHVVASEKFAASKQFYPESDEEANEIVFFEKPFIKLKFNPGKSGNLEVNDLIQTAQEELDSRIELPILEIYPNTRRISIGNKVVQMQPLPFAVYFFFAKKAGKFLRGGKSFSDKNLSEIWEIYCKYTPSQGHLQRAQSGLFEKGKLNFENLQKSISVIKNQITQALDNELMSDFYIISTLGSYADKKYGIKLSKNRIKIVK